MLLRNATLVLSRHPLNHLQIGPEQLVLCSSSIAARQQGVPPQTTDDLARRILERARLTVASDGEVMRTVSAVLEDQGVTQDPMGMAGVLLPIINRLFRSGGDLRRLEAAGERPAFVTRIAIETRQRLDRLMLVAAADAIARAVECEPPRVPLCVFGFPRLNHMDLVMIDVMAGDGSRIYLPFSEGMKLFEEADIAARYLSERGWSVQYPEDLPRNVGQVAADRFLRVPHTHCSVQARSYPTMAAEVRGVLHEIKAGIAEGRFKASEAVIVTRSEQTYGPMVTEVAHEYGIPIRMQYAATVADSRFGQWLNSLLEVCLAGEYPFEATARLVHHPLSARLKGENWSEERWQEARSLHARGQHEWQTLGIDTEVMLNQESATRYEWYTHIRDFLHKLEAGKLAGERAQDADAYSQLMDILAELSLPTEEVVERKVYFAQIRDAMRATSVLAFPGRVGVDFHTPLSLFGATVPHIFVLGSAEGMLPQSVRDDSYLDYHERARLAELGAIELESAALTVRRENLSFYSLLLSAEKSLTFTYPRLMGTNAVLPSPFLDRLGAMVEERGDTEEVVASESEYLAAMLCDSATESDKYAQRARHAWATVLHREAGGSLDSHTGHIGVPFAWESHTFSAQQITCFGQCPYRWFGAYLLRIGEPEEADDDLAPATKGKLFHEVLSRSIRATRNAPDVRRAILARLESEFDAVARDDTWATRAAGWRSRRPELLAQLQRAVEGADFLMEGARPDRTELDFNATWHGLRVRGRIDRIDRIGDNRYIVDYKTSSAKPSGVKDESGKLKLDVQLPLYMAVTGAAGGYYYSLTNAKNLIEYALPGSRSGMFDEAPLQRLAAGLTVSLTEGRYAVEPDDGMHACTYCEMDLVCRRGPHLQRKPEPAG